MSFWDWLLRRKRPKAPLTDAEAMRLALEELGRRHQSRKKKGQLRHRHIDDFRELEIPETKPDTISEDLLYLTRDTYEHRFLYGNDDKERVDLTGQPDAADGAAAAARAAEDAKADMQKKGLKLDHHYYRAAERQQTGEIQETYEIGEGEEKK